MVIKGTNKIKGILDLSSIGLQLTKTSVFGISDNDYWNSDVQSAIRMGFLVVAGDPSKKHDSNNPKILRCINSFHRPITIKEIGEIQPNHSFTLPEIKLGDPDIKLAMNRGMITVTQSVDPSDHSEGFLELGNLFAKESASKKKQQEKEASEFKEQLKQKTLDSQDTKYDRLETNEEIKSLGDIVDNESKIVWNPSSNKPVVSSIKNAITSNDDNDDKSNLIDTPNPDPVQAADTRHNSLVMNPTNTQVTNTAKDAFVHNPNKTSNRVIDTPNPDPVQAPELKNKAVVSSPGGHKTINESKQSLAWNPTRVPQQSIPKSASIEETAFVDQDEEKERIANHPVLGKKEIVERDDDPIAPDSVDANRIAKHPVLKNKPRQNDEIDFVG